ncbi:hypothetical protein SAMN04487970_102711 [Paenibacillus tianmuensis]|uniref:Uncharacterized protein n=1 Tax=Paenibacillus tianmuensis TaxID=624147 RepID=A0A1G4SDT8_9BACL|nr:hypothetical protein [Paenibacillus tianmuensis]SCW67392.1 hypothetical protein SAMN04487970_102711 [Paenibacillus tianmuensis]
MSRSFITLLIFCCFIVGCSQTKITTTETSLSFGGISIGFTEKEIVNIMGKATSIDAKSNNIKEIVYTGTKGPNAAFILENDRLKEATWYPSVYDGKLKIPMKKEDIDTLIDPSILHKVEKVDCYEWAQCSNYVFEKGKNRLEILLDWEGKLIDRVKLQ